MALNPRRNPLNLIRVMPAKGRKAMAEYIRVLWKHDSPDEPIEMHYEVLEDRAVVRMVERFIDGHANADTIEWQKARDLDTWGQPDRWRHADRAADPRRDRKFYAGRVRIL
jgi:hypothetical protein